MKKQYHIILLAAVSMLIAATGCLKKVDIPETNNVAVTFNNSGSKFLTGDVTVNPKDSLLFDFTITSPTDMKYVVVQKNATSLSGFLTKDTLSTANKNSFSAVKRFVADSVIGVYTYRIMALDATGIYVGSKTITVTVNPDFIYYTARNLYVPDSAAKTTKSFLSASTGETFSFTEAMAKSNLIDFGYYYDTTQVMAGSPATLTPKGHTIFSPSISPFAPYDLSTWTTRNNTKMKLSSLAFTSFTSAGYLRSQGIAALGSGTVSRISTTDRAATSIPSHLTGQVIVFQTAAGKYGVLQVNFTNHNGPAQGSYINVDVKIEK